MSQHLIHVCVTDAPAWSQREGGKSKEDTEIKPDRVEEGGKKRKGMGMRGGRQHNGANEKEGREGKADKKNRDPVNQISQENKSKVKRWVNRKVSPLPLLCFNAQRLLRAAGTAHGQSARVPAGND